MENLTIAIETNSKRLLLLAFGSAMLVFAGLSFVWGIANTAAMQAEEKELAELMVTLAPSDPQTHYAAALLLDGSFEPSDFERASYHYERAAALAPYNYFLWLELGRARERRGDREGGLKALGKAKELAPNYSSVRWSVGNALVRQGSVEEGFDEIIGAVGGDEKYASPAAGLAWQIAEGDAAIARRYLRGSTEALGELAVTIARDGRLDDSMALAGSRKISDFASVTVEARITRAGSASSSSGDLFGRIAGVKPGNRKLRLVIDQVQP